MHRFNRSRGGRLFLVPAAVVLLALGLAGAGLAAKKSNGHFKADSFKAKVKHRVLFVTGDDAGSSIALRLAARNPNVLQIDVGDDGTADDSIRRESFDRIQVDAGGGRDTVRMDESNGIFTDTEQTTIDGGDGNDRLLGGSGAEAFIGGGGDDFVDGNRGNDSAALGAGDDEFHWDPGDGSDTVEGREGHDVLDFAGANVDEKVDLSANGPRLRFFRNVANVTMDTDGVEQVKFQALGGVDNVTVHDLSATDVTEVDTDLAATLGGTAPDGAADLVTVQGTDGADAIQALGQAGSTSVVGLSALVRIDHADPTLDKLSMESAGGDDTVSATTLRTDAIKLSVDGGPGADTMLGGDGADVFIGSDGNDFVDGNRGDDLGLMGAGDDTFQWDPGDGNDTIEGQDGVDTMLFNGANIAEKVELSANGPRLRFTRDIATITMDTNDLERVIFRALGGADTVTVNDLSGTDVTDVRAELAAAAGGGDGAADSVIVRGTNGDDVVSTSGDANATRVGGLASAVTIVGAEADRDLLRIEGLAGDDVLEAQDLAANAIGLALDGAEGNDVLIGGSGADSLSGGPGDDVLIGGPGADRFACGDGADVVLGDGTDTVAADCE
jgi:Ca2+-binding RTX toxin-like protein